MSSPAIYKVAISRQNRETGVGIEQLVEVDGKMKVVFIGSYFIGEASRQETVRFYCREIMKRHEPGEEILIGIGDPMLSHKRKWLQIYPENIKLLRQAPSKFKTCSMLAFDAGVRRNTITEEF